MKTYITLAALCACGINTFAHEVTPEDVTVDNVRQCIEQRVESGQESREAIIESMKKEIRELYDAGSISEEAAHACLEAVNEYAA